MFWQLCNQFSQRFPADLLRLKNSTFFDLLIFQYLRTGRQAASNIRFSFQPVFSMLQARSYLPSMKSYTMNTENPYSQVNWSSTLQVWM